MPKKSKSINELPLDPKLDLTRSPQKTGRNMPQGSEMRNPQGTK